MAKRQLYGGVEEQPEKIIEKTCSLVHPAAPPAYAPSIQYYSDFSSGKLRSLQGPDSEEELAPLIKEDTKDKVFYNYITDLKTKSQRGPSMADCFHSLVDMEAFVEVVSSLHLQKGVRDVPYNLKPCIFIRKFNIDIYPNCQNILKKLINSQYKVKELSRPLSMKSIDAPQIQPGKKVKHVLLEFQTGREAIRMAEHLQNFKPRLYDTFTLGYFNNSIKSTNWVAVVLRNLPRGTSSEFIMMKMHPPEHKLNIKHVTQITKVRN